MKYSKQWLCSNEPDIKCRSHSQTAQVVAKLHGMGFEVYTAGAHEEHGTVISIYDDARYIIIVKRWSIKCPVISAAEFLADTA